MGGLFVIFFVPETKALTLEEMDEVFGSVGLAAADEERHAEIAQRIGLMKYTSKDPSTGRRTSVNDDKVDDGFLDAEKQ